GSGCDGREVHDPVIILILIERFPPDVLRRDAQEQQASKADSQSICAKVRRHAAHNSQPLLGCQRPVELVINILIHETGRSLSILMVLSLFDRKRVNRTSASATITT